MTFPSIDPKIVEKIISLVKAGHGRNQIERELHDQGIKVSRGSITNVIKRYKADIQRSLQENTNSIHANPSESAQSSNISIGAPLNITGSSTSVQPHGIELANPIHRVGGPLYHLLNNLTNEEVEEPKPIRNLLVKDPEVDTKINDVINQYAIAEQQRREREKSEQSHQPEPSAVAKDLSTVETKKSGLNIDWDSDEYWEGRVIRYYMNDKKERKQHEQLMERRIKELQEEQQRLTLMMETIEQKNNDLKVREAKIKEIEPLLPSIRELHNAGITFDIIMSYMIAINEKSALEKIDLKTAAYKLRQDFTEYRNIENLRIIIADAEKRLKILADHIRQNESAINALKKLKSIGYTEKQIMKLTAAVNGSKKLDTELINVGNLQQSNINGKSQQPSNSNPSMSDWIRLNLLKQNTTRQLNRMGVPY